MSDSTRFYGRLKVKKAPVSAVGSAGGVLLTSTVDGSGLSGALRDALGGWRKPLAVHDPAKVLTDLGVTVALGGDCLADTAVLRAEPGVYGLVGSHATMSRTVGVLAKDADTVLAAVAAARRTARARVWQLAGPDAPNHGITPATPLIVDLDATLLTSHSEKEHAAPTFKKGFGFHPLCAFIDHGKQGTGEVLAIHLRKGNAGSNTVNDHICITKDALQAIPGVNASRPGRKILIRTDGGGGTKGFLAWLTARGLSYSIGFTLPASTPQLYRLIPEQVWEAAINDVSSSNDDHDEIVVREDAGVADFTSLLRDKGLLVGWPPTMRVIVRREKPHVGAQLRFDDVDGYRLTAFATNTASAPGPHLADLELRHRQRGRCENRIKVAKDCGLRNLPLQGFDQNRIWCAVVMLALDVTAWTQLLAFTPGQDARRWEPKRLRLRLFTIPAALVRHGRQRWLHVKATAAWADLVVDGLARINTLARAAAIP